jgi:homoserine dehydrogenase
MMQALELEHEVRAAVPPLRVALAGCGVVGGGVLGRLADDARFEVVGILIRDTAKVRQPVPDPRLLVTDPAALLAREPDVLVDALSDPSTGLALTRAALARGVHVASANKQAVADDLFPLARQAHRSGVRLGIAACVGGGAPMIETVRAARAHAPIVAVEAVLNGTVNFLLNRLAQGASFEAAVAEAQALGLAEADPSADLSGRDAAAKLAILAAEAFGPHGPRPGQVQPLAAAHRGRAVRQLARAAPDAASVRLVDVEHDPLFADLPGATNALRVTCADGRTFTCTGEGAGREPTTDSVMGDLLSLIAEGRLAPRVVAAGADGAELRRRLPARPVAGIG